MLASLVGFRLFSCMPRTNSGFESGLAFWRFGGVKLRDTAQRKFGQLCFL
jgi:hypothetical protein